MITQTSFMRGKNVPARVGLALPRPPRPPLRSRLVPSPSLHPSDFAPGLLIGDDVEIGEGVLIGGQAVIHSGAWIGDGARIGDHAQIRDGARIGAGSTIGSYSSVDPGVVVGERVSVQTRCYLTGGTVIEDDVFVGPGVTMTNDNTMDRHGPEQEFEGPLLRRACRVGGGVVLCPGVEIGEEAFVAAGALVTKDVPPRAVVMGAPARQVREVPDEDLLERWR
jgi:acetyltransferase-like isoleucine patch superfamily enzyme